MPSPLSKTDFDIRILILTINPGRNVIMEREYKVTTGGRITIPAELRRKHGIKSPAKILIEELKDGIKIYQLNKKTKKKFQL